MSRTQAGNLLSTKTGLLFIDLETCCRRPVEFDLAHVPKDVSERYADVDEGLLSECRVLVLAMVAAWRWDPGDQFPNGQGAARESPQHSTRGSAVAGARRRDAPAGRYVGDQPGDSTLIACVFEYLHVRSAVAGLVVYARRCARGHLWQPGAISVSCV